MEPICNHEPPCQVTSGVPDEGACCRTKVHQSRRPAKGWFGRVEDILFGEERLQVELATCLYQRDKAMYTKQPDEIRKMIVDR